MRPCCVDRLTDLPYELLAQILSMLPTKDAAATQLVSKRMKQAFCWISTIDLDDSPESHCVKRPNLVERFALFESFVDNVLHKLSRSQQSLTRFRLRMGLDKTIIYLCSCVFNTRLPCKEARFPEPARLYAWISYPLAHCGLRELDLSCHLKNPAECKLPPEIFARQSLQVLKLDINVEINGETEIPVICLPNLKLLNLRSFVFTEDDFVTRLVSNCPVLEDLAITCWWLKADRLIISSHSLRKFVFIIRKYHHEDKNSDLVLIDTPNLQYFDYFGNLPYKYSITNLNALDEAEIDVDYPLVNETLEDSFRTQLSLARALSNVERLSLHGYFVEILYIAGVLEDQQLPVFRNLRTLKMTALLNTYCYARWDILLLLILHCAPLLEQLFFPQGFFEHGFTCVSDYPEVLEVAALEANGWRKTQTIPSCCQSHLKRILIKRCCGSDREVNMIKFLLGNASILTEFVILCNPA
ncbi:F-box/LRR-repeat protein At4g14103-like [Silene latifolia]|uniref:F-box/LRR-repeat protein At4g14103-like n=1 Tax=Silene latifolia TaxID=37657 RepID=UPI003D784EE0